MTSLVVLQQVAERAAAAPHEGQRYVSVDPDVVVALCQVAQAARNLKCCAQAADEADTGFAELDAALDALGAALGDMDA